jgi:putative peptidoglycan lipid II flippase
MTAWALTAYSVGLAGYAAIKVLSPAFYALDDAKTPMYISLVSIILHVPTSFGLMQLLSTVGVTAERPNGFGHAGVALATSIVALANLTALAWFMRRRIGRLNGREIVSSFVRVMIASAAMSAAAYGSYYLLTNYLGEKALLVKLAETFVPISLAVIVFLITAKLLRIKEVETIIRAVSSKLRRQS